MTKPDDVPQDVWDDAAKVVEGGCGCAPGRRRANGTSHADSCWHQTHRVANTILAAVMAEREACAQVVDTLAGVIGDEIASAATNASRQVLSTQRHALQTAAAAIMRRP